MSAAFLASGFPMQSSLAQVVAPAPEYIGEPLWLKYAPAPE